MQFFRQNRRLIAWLASLAIVLNLLAPAISHAMTANDDVLLMEVCSAAGNKSAIAIPLNTGQPADSTDSQNAMQHCPYCLTHAGSFALMADAQPLFLDKNLSYSLPKLFYHAPRPLFAWAANNPRAPPISS